MDKNPLEDTKKRLDIQAKRLKAEAKQGVAELRASVEKSVSGSISDRSGFTLADRKSTFLKKWRIENFKRVKSAVVEFAPLTVLVGSNSAGKSSLLQSILLFAQNARRNNRIIDTQARGQIILNGDLVSLGSVNEALNTESLNDTSNLEFGGTFSLGQDFYPPAFIRQNKRYGDQLDWSIKLVAADNNDYSGLANVLDSKAQLMLNGVCLEKVDLTRTNGSHIEVIKYEPNPRFSYVHKAVVVEYPDKESIKTEKVEDYSAISFASGLPIEGLVQKPMFEIALEELLNAWNGWDGTFEEVLEMRIESRSQQESLFQTFETVDEALASAVNAFGHVLLKLNQVEDSDGMNGPLKFASRRNAISHVIDFETIPWNIIMKNTSEGRGEKQLLESLQSDHAQYGTSSASEDSEIESEIKLFRERFVSEVRAKYSLTPEAVSMEFDERMRGARRSRYSSSTIFDAVDNWNRYLTEGIRYLEPLREVPKAFYTYATGGGINPQIPLGSRGEHLAQALYDKTPRVYPLPNFSLQKKKAVSLIEAVNMWLPELGIDGQIEVVPQGRQGFYLTVGGHVLPMLGTGISQILPVLTLCLTARQGDLVILEQPELHLNPSIQQKLAEFLLKMSMVQRQIIVETHSEYFVTRLRLVQARDSKVSKFIKLLFVEKTKEHGTTYREVETNTFGEIQEWPKGFFDQASNDLRELMKVIAGKKAKKIESETNTSEQ